MLKFINLILLIIILPFSQKVFSGENKLTEQAIHSPLSKESLLLASDQYGFLSIVVGERGHILYSYDAKSWVQADVDTKATLTNVFMFDDKVAWAVGHDAVILKTIDGAKTWQKVFSNKDEEAPLLDIYFKDALHGIAIGAYGLMLVTSDGGTHWQKRGLIISNHSDVEINKTRPESTGIYDLHLNAIIGDKQQRLYLAAEAGHIFRSDDGGITWEALPSPYRGSFFGLLSLSLDELIVYGLRGHLYRSSDAGFTWKQLETHSTEMLTDAVKLRNGDIVITGLGGTLLSSKDNGSTFSILNLNNRYSLSSIIETKEGELVIVGDMGIEVLSSKYF